MKTFINLQVFAVLLICCEAAWKGRVEIVNPENGKKRSAVLLTKTKIAILAEAYKAIGSPTLVYVDVGGGGLNVKVTPSKSLPIIVLTMAADMGISNIVLLVGLPELSDILPVDINKLVAVASGTPAKTDTLTKLEHDLIIDEDMALEMKLDVKTKTFWGDVKQNIEERVGDLVYSMDGKTLYGMIIKSEKTIGNNQLIESILMSQNDVLKYLISEGGVQTNAV